MPAKAGDVYCVYNFHLKKYTACQITKIEEGEKKPQAVLLSLDWSGKAAGCPTVFRLVRKTTS